MVSPPKILLTTSRNPTLGIRTFCNDLAHVLPSLLRVNRGKMSADEVAEKALEYDAERVVIVDRWHGGWGSIKFFQVDESGLVSVPPVIHIASMRLRREFGVSGVKPALSLAVSEQSAKVLMAADALSRFFGIPLLSSNETIESGSTVMYVSVDMSNKIVITFMVVPNEVEVGPRIAVSRMEW